MAIEEGKAAPAFTLTDQNGAEVSLESLQGRNVVVYFYPKDDTPGCTKQACGFRDLWTQIVDRDVALLGVSPDDAESHQSFIEKYELPFTLLSDPSQEMIVEYDAFGEKTWAGKTSMGVIRSTVWIGPDGNVKKHWAEVKDAAAHPAEILETLSAEDG
jgi:thioredoxin-dependent peroxiredoxin